VVWEWKEAIRRAPGQRWWVLPAHNGDRKLTKRQQHEASACGELELVYGASALAELRLVHGDQWMLPPLKNPAFGNVVLDGLELRGLFLTGLAKRSEAYNGGHPMPQGWWLKPLAPGQQPPEFIPGWDAKAAFSRWEREKVGAGAVGGVEPA